MRNVCIVVCLLIPAIAGAAASNFLVPETPYAVVPIGKEPEVPQEYYGTLAGDPVMYEFMSEAPFALTLTVAQPMVENPEPLSALVVAVERTGRVSEVARIRPLGEWQPERDHVLGVTFLVGETYAAQLPPGTYRVEVSSALNQGRYQLRLGDQTASSLGYGATWKRVLAVNDFLGRSTFALLGSWFVLTHVIVFVLAVLGVRYLYKKQRSPRQSL